VDFPIPTPPVNPQTRIDSIGLHHHTVGPDNGQEKQAFRELA
jgi:hypothetical protein